MMSLRSGVSNQLAAALLARCRRHLTGGAAMSIRLPVWRMVPQFAKNWLSYRVLADVERLALEEVQSHEVLGRFASELEQNRFAMSPSALLYLWRLLEASRPHRIVEFGSGLSTRLFGQYAVKMKSTGQRVSLLSIDHDEKWLSESRSALERDQTTEFVAFCHAPISRQQLLGRELDAYSVPDNVFEAHAGDTGFELCLIDGPPGAIGRGGCLPLVAAYLALDAIVLLDDAIRPGESAVCRSWSDTYRDECVQTRIQLLDQHGLMQTTWKGPGFAQRATANAFPAETSAQANPPAGNSAKNELV